MANILYSKNDTIESRGEEKIISYFEKNAPENWTIIHSLLLRDHPNQRQGEIDLVVIAPEYGVFVIEVKGGSIKCSNKTWTSINQNGVINNIHDPFSQASKNSFGLEEYLYKNNIQIKVGYGVAFPDTTFKMESISYAKDTLFDYSDRDDVVSFIKRLSLYYRKEKHFPVPDENAINNAAKKLCSEWNFEYIEPLNSKIDNTNSYLVRLTEEQLKIVDKLEYARAVIHGSAGTGKTLLAIECAKRISNNGKKVALVTYGLLLTNFLKTQLKDYPQISVFSISDYFEKKVIEFGYYKDVEYQDNIIKVTKPLAEYNYDEKSHFYSVVLPKLAIRFLSEHPVYYDCIIVDESQDFGVEYLLLLSLMEEEHMARGQYLFFGDYIMQGVFDVSLYNNEFLAALRAMDAKFEQTELKTNCRNNRTIILELNRICGLDPKNTREDSEKIYTQYNDIDEEAVKLRKLLNRLLHNDKVAPNKITILGSYNLDKTENVCNRLKDEFKIEQYRADNRLDTVTYSTRRKFKGLENDVIILVDFNVYHSKDILYASLSRARTEVYVFESTKAWEERVSWSED